MVEWLDGVPALTLDGQEPSQIVERRPQIVDGIGNDDAEVGRWQLVTDETANRYLGSVRLWLGFESVGLRIEEPLHSLVKFAQVSFGPINFPMRSLGVEHER
jgi:hypothetical protein